MLNAFRIVLALLVFQTNSEPNPYRIIDNFFKMPDGRTWGSTSAVEAGRDGRTLWVAERCGQNSCLDRATGRMSDLPSILKFDASGMLVKSFGMGMLIFPHGIHVDRDGNVWVTDGQDNAPQPPRGGTPRTGPPPEATGNSVSDTYGTQLLMLRSHEFLLPCESEVSE